ncbi:MAG: ParB/RepB/Spo0J family partition protein [Phyllobacteriaceae bacterium]|nr:ParB/RepB/Spo0J family partition protein [Phyllobacteriaceae bacterium]
MSEIKQIKLTDIHVPERLRAVDDAHVAAISKSIELHGLLHPITVRFTPNGERKYALVAGAHRLKAVAILGEEAIDAIVVKADALGAQIIEIEENLWRNDLSALDRATFVQTYRDLWEQKHGKIARGGDQRAKLALCPVDMLEEAIGEGFTTACAERLGISKRSVKRLSQIAGSLPADLKKRLSGTAIADNQSQLLALAKLPEDKRAIAARAVDDHGADFAKVMDVIAPKPRLNAQGKVLSQLIAGWSKASPTTRRKFMEDAGLMPMEDADG